MAKNHFDNLLRHIRKLVGAKESAETSDGQLLARFADRHDEAAFEALLDRHAKMVLGVCRRILPDRHLAEDAFQSTFLVLGKKAGSIRKQESVGSWLYGVAYRLAVQMKKSERRQAQERQVEDMAQPDGIPELEWRELRPALDEEVQRLPEKYRSPIVLCCIEGLTKAEAAKQLGWKEGTLSGRLARARDLLRDRLTQRGITLSAGTLGVLLTEKVLSAATPASLIQSTLKAVVLFAAGKSVAGAVSAGVVGFAEGALQAMFMTKLKIAAAMVLTLLVDRQRRARASGRWRQGTSRCR